MKAFYEVTEWRDVVHQPNHVYWMNNSKNKIYAYARYGNPNDTQTFTSPIVIDSRGRQFVEVRHDIYGWQDLEEPTMVNARVIKVQGSRGDIYHVTDSQGQWSCTCSGFQFRGACRHIAEAKNQLAS